MDDLIKLTTSERNELEAILVANLSAKEFKRAQALLLLTNKIVLPRSPNCYESRVRRSTTGSRAFNTDAHARSRNVYEMRPAKGDRQQSVKSSMSCWMKFSTPTLATLDTVQRFGQQNFSSSICETTSGFRPVSAAFNTRLSCCLDAR